MKAKQCQKGRNGFGGHSTHTTHPSYPSPSLGGGTGNTRVEGGVRWGSQNLDERGQLNTHAPMQRLQGEAESRPGRRARSAVGPPSMRDEPHGSPVGRRQCPCPWVIWATVRNKRDMAARGRGRGTRPPAPRRKAMLLTRMPNGGKRGNRRQTAEMPHIRKEAADGPSLVCRARAKNKAWQQRDGDDERWRLASPAEADGHKRRAQLG